MLACVLAAFRAWMFCCQDSCGFPARCVSIPAHLLSFFRSNPNPVKGFWGLLPSGRGLPCLAGTNQGYRYLPYSFYIYCERGEKDGFLLWGFMISIKGRLRRRHPKSNAHTQKSEDPYLKQNFNKWQRSICAPLCSRTFPLVFFLCCGGSFASE